MLGLKPYEGYDDKATEDLAMSIIRAMKGPMDMEVKEKYVKNLAMLVSL